MWFRSKRWSRILISRRIESNKGTYQSRGCPTWHDYLVGCFWSAALWYWVVEGGHANNINDDKKWLTKAAPLSAARPENGILTLGEPKVETAEFRVIGQNNNRKHQNTTGFLSPFSTSDYISCLFWHFLREINFVKTFLWTPRPGTPVWVHHRICPKPGESPKYITSYQQLYLSVPGPLIFSLGLFFLFHNAT